MGSSVIKYAIWWIICLVVQLFFLNKLNIDYFINPQFYIFFLILLPVFTERHVILLLAFATGLAIDMFEASGGIHAAACVIATFFRGPILRAFAPREGYGKDDFLTIEKFGLGNFILYAGFFILIHHWALFFIEVFSFKNFFFTLLRTISSGFVTLLLITIAAMGFFAKSSGSK
ncbi:MAG TPA: hypothetical protein VIL57_05965 [Bacteroidia bacterium]